MTLNLFDSRAPQTVANFFDYINSGSYDNAIFNRRTNPAATTATPAGDGIGVLQGGALKLNSTGNGFSLVPIGPTIPNEFGASNTLGTIAMAQFGSDRNSATNQFYFNTTTNAASLDAQLFTVFGAAADDASRAVLASLAATPIQDVHNTTLTHDFPPAGFNQVPLNNYTGTSAAFPGAAHASNFLVINSIDVVKRSEFLTYSIVGNTNTSLVNPSIQNEFLTLNAIAGHAGTARITLRATDRFGAHMDQVLTVNITAAPAVTSVAITPNLASNVTTLTATPVANSILGNANPVTFTYQWFQNGFPLSTGTTQTLTLSTVTKISPADKFTVKVTPRQLTGAVTTIGATFTSNAVTIATASPDPITLVP
jgi:cyclophilin family peptidyl-prolyl cis-trans isomerase